jgi:3-oxoacyl-[acyl-carrier protein] reductase
MSNKLEDKVAFVSGGSRGIGAAIAKRLAADGARVAITYAKGADAAAEVVKTIEGAGGKAIAIQADATNPAAVKAAIDKVVASLGKLDVLVNNAGTAIPKKFEEATLEELDRVININLRGVFITTQAALKQMNNGGRIITIGSCVGERMMTPGLVAYSATKGAIRMFTQDCLGRWETVALPSTIFNRVRSTQISTRRRANGLYRRRQTRRLIAMARSTILPRWLVSSRVRTPPISRVPT